MSTKLTKDKSSELKQSLDTLYHIAIDGPAASGKGTIARALSSKLGIPCLDTGALYRALAVYLHDLGVDVKDENAVLTVLPQFKLEVKIIDGATQVAVNGKNVTTRIRENEISQIASAIAVYPTVRKLMTEYQRDIAKRQSFILEGRDICSAVLPDAQFKFYLTAKLKRRAERRVKDLALKGTAVTLKDMMKQIKERDKRDLEKGGLKKVQEAIVIDSSKQTEEETINAFYKIISIQIESMK